MEFHKLVKKLLLIIENFPILLLILYMTYYCYINFIIKRVLNYINGEILYYVWESLGYILFSMIVDMILLLILRKRLKHPLLSIISTLIIIIFIIFFGENFNPY